MFKALYSDSITLHLINQDNVADVYALFQGYPDSDELLVEIAENYLPRYVDGKRTNYGFYTTLNDELASLSLLIVGRHGKDQRGLIRLGTCGEGEWPRAANRTCFIWPSSYWS
ncbi:hypothetical protein [Spirosoma fluminis]